MSVLLLRMVDSLKLQGKRNGLLWRKMQISHGGSMSRKSSSITKNVLLVQL